MVFNEHFSLGVNLASIPNKECFQVKIRTTASLVTNYSSFFHQVDISLLVRDMAGVTSSLVRLFKSERDVIIMVHC